mgnify:CR=1 FL=1
MKKNISTFSIAATYIGTVVGAGFASGQEVLQYFGCHGAKGYLGLAAATVIFIVFGYIMMALGQKLGADSHYKVVMYAAGPCFGRIVDGIITIFLFVSLTAMFAGTGAIFKQQLGLPEVMGNAFMAVITLVTVLTGISGIINAISTVAPVLMTGVFFMGGYTLFTHAGGMPASGAAFMQPVIPDPLLSGIVYASYNLVTAVAILAPLGKEAYDRSRLRSGALWGGVGLGLSAAMIQTTLLMNMPAAAGYEIPLLYVADGISPYFTIAYSIIMIAEIYSTAIADLYGFAARFADPRSAGYVVYLFAAAIAAVICSRLGFSNMVRYLYSAEGIAGMILLVGMAVTAISGRL